MGKVKCEIRKVSIWAQVEGWETIARLAHYLSEIEEIRMINYEYKVGSSEFQTVEFYCESILKEFQIFDRIKEDEITETIKGLYCFTVNTSK